SNGDANAGIGLERSLIADNLYSIGNIPIQVNSNNQLYLLAQSQAQQINTSLSLQSLVNSLRGIKPEGTNPANSRAEVPILPQTGLADIYQGVYAFDPSVENSQGSPRINSTSLRTNFFTAPLSPPGIGTQGLRSFGIQPVNPRGLINSGGNNFSNSLSLPSPPARVGIPKSGIGEKSIISQLPLPNLNAELAKTPTNDFSALLNDPNSEGLTQLLNLLNSFGNLKLSVNFPILPQQTLATSATLSDKPFNTSDIVGQKVNFESSLLPQLREQQQQQQQALQELQQQQQEQINQQLEQARQQAEIAQLQQEKRYKEQLEKLTQQQEERQRQLEDQLEEQLREQKRLQDEFRRQLAQKR
ncbi:MAG: hypothetical protein ACRDEA_19905, partial [Microcystaceae cyanobacterium]